MAQSRHSKITVVTPSFNRALLIRRALDSVLVQTRLPAQIIVVDDASSDGTPEVVKGWASEHGFPVRVEVLETNSGPATARNRGIELADTEFIAFLDSDDEYLPDTLARQMAGFEYCPEAVLSFADATVITNETRREAHALLRPHLNLTSDAEKIAGTTEPVYRLRDPKTKLLKASIIPTSATCFRRDAALGVGGMPTTFRSGEDWLFWLRLADRGAFVFQMDDLTLHHRHDANLTHARSAEFLAREKLYGYLALVEDSVAVKLNPHQLRIAKVFLKKQVRTWRYHLSLLGVREYIRGINDLKCSAIGTPAMQIFTDLKSLVRAIYSSIRI